MIGEEGTGIGARLSEDGIEQLFPTGRSVALFCPAARRFISMDARGVVPGPVREDATPSQDSDRERFRVIAAPGGAGKIGILNVERKRLLRLNAAEEGGGVELGHGDPVVAGKDPEPDPWESFQVIDPNPNPNPDWRASR